MNNSAPHRSGASLARPSANRRCTCRTTPSFITNYLDAKSGPPKSDEKANTALEYLKVFLIEPQQQMCIRHVRAMAQRLVLVIDKSLSKDQIYHKLRFMLADIQSGHSFRDILFLQRSGGMFLERFQIPISTWDGSTGLMSQAGKAPATNYFADKRELLIALRAINLLPTSYTNEKGELMNCTDEYHIDEYHAHGQLFIDNALEWIQATAQDVVDILKQDLAMHRAHMKHTDKDIQRLDNCYYSIIQQILARYPRLAMLRSLLDPESKYWVIHYPCTAGYQFERGQDVSAFHADVDLSRSYDEDGTRFILPIDNIALQIAGRLRNGDVFEGCKIDLDRRPIDTEGHTTIPTARLEGDKLGAKLSLKLATQHISPFKLLAYHPRAVYCQHPPPKDTVNRSISVQFTNIAMNGRHLLSSTTTCGVELFLAHKHCHPPAKTSANRAVSLTRDRRYNPLNVSLRLQDPVSQAMVGQLRWNNVLVQRQRQRWTRDDPVGCLDNLKAEIVQRARTIWPQIQELEELSYREKSFCTRLKKAHLEQERVTNPDTRLGTDELLQKLLKEHFEEESR